MARFLKPLVRSGGYYPSRRWTPLVYPGGYTTANGGEEPAPPPVEKTVIGNPIHILDALAKPVQALSIALEPIQDLHGYDNPWPAGGGKNKLPNGAQSATVNNVQYAVNAVDGSITANGTSNGWTGLAIGQCTLPAGTWYLESGVTTGYADYYLEAQIGGVNYSTNVTGGRRQFVLSAETSVSVKLYVRSGATVTNAICYPMIRADNAGTAYSPYSNVCPISGHTDADVIVSPTLNPADGTTYPIPLGQTVYSGTLDVVSGLMTVTHGNIASYAGESLPGEWISDRDVYSAGGTPTTGAQVVYELSTPQTYQLTPTEVTLLLGENNIWSDGEMTLVYLADGNASDVEALNILLGGRYVNNHGADEPTDREALNIILGGNER